MLRWARRVGESIDGGEEEGREGKGREVKLRWLGSFPVRSRRWGGGFVFRANPVDCWLFGWGLMALLGLAAVREAPSA